MINFTFWQDGDFFLGYLNDYPDYQTQANSLDELKENSKDIYQDILGDNVPFIRKTMSLNI